MPRRHRLFFLLLLTVWLIAAVLYALLLTTGNGHEPADVTTSEEHGLRHFSQETVQIKNFSGLGPELPRVSSGTELPDPRHPRCSRFDKWRPSLGTVSVVISFYNEDAAPLARTVHSVLRRTPKSILEEIILVDDFSIDGSVAKVVSELPKVKVHRNERREGLIRSRDFGARLARGTHLFFLDSHCEVNVGWVLPLMHALKQSPRALVSPVIDVIDQETLEYRPSSSNLKGGFDWGLRFRWLPLTEKEIRGKSPEDPFRTPITPGGLFMIRKDWYLELGGFDPGLEIWGIENFEMSVKSWLCGGEVLTSRCSRVGHVFRPHHPYSFPMGAEDTQGHNARRLVDVWFDQYRTNFYQGQAALGPNTRPGNLTSRLQLKSRLSCKPFRWFLDSVYPELRPTLLREISAAGQLRRGELCLDAQESKVRLTSCLLDRPSQVWSLSKEGDVVFGNGSHCLVATSKMAVALDRCAGEDRKRKLWLRRRRSLRHIHAGLCLSVLDSSDGRPRPVLAACDPTAYGQSWDFTTELQAWS